jgi:DNA-binding NarL/FixJ family response regulator
VREAQGALTQAEEMGAAAEATRARELLWTLGVSPKAARAVRRGAVLTRREIEILRLVAEGLTDGDIAARLVLSKHTVHRHLQNAYAKLGCSSRAAAVTKANKQGLL